jgi:hypothetical protein
VIVKDKTANTNCGFGQHSLMCFQDNDGLSCTGNVSPNINELNQPIGSCVLQIVSPASSTGVTTTYNSGTTKTTSIVAKNTGGSESASSNDPHLAEKIAIPVGTVVGVAAISGATYYFIRKRKKGNQQSEGDRQFTSNDQNEAFELQRLQAENELLQQQLAANYQAQVQVNPYQNNSQYYK